MAIEEGIRISPPVRGAPAFGHVGPQPPEDPAIQSPPHSSQIANPKVIPPAPEHRRQQSHEFVHPARLLAPRHSTDLAS